MNKFKDLGPEPAVDGFGKYDAKLGFRIFALTSEHRYFKLISSTVGPFGRDEVRNEVECFYMPLSVVITEVAKFGKHLGVVTSGLASWLLDRSRLSAYLVWYVFLFNSLGY